MLGKSHRIVRRLRALRRDSGLRAEEGVLIAEGQHLADEVLATEATIELAAFAPDLPDRSEGRRLLELLEERGIERHEIARSVFDGLQDARSPQPILLVVRRPESTIRDCLESPHTTPMLVVAHGIQDPGNLGTVLRTAAAAGASGLLTTGVAADLYHPRAVRASAGAIFRLPVARAEIGQVLDLGPSRGLRMLGADARGERPYDRVAWDEPFALWLGGESAGLPATVRRALDETVGIPMRGNVESLSVGAAAAILLFAADRTRSAKRTNRPAQSS